MKFYISDQPVEEAIYFDQNVGATRRQEDLPVYVKDDKGIVWKRVTINGLGIYGAAYSQTVWVTVSPGDNRTQTKIPENSLPVEITDVRTTEQLVKQGDQLVVPDSSDVHTVVWDAAACAYALYGERSQMVWSYPRSSSLAEFSRLVYASGYRLKS